MKSLGLSDEQLERTKAVMQQRDNQVEGEGLWAEHLPAFEAFCAVDSQWRTRAMGLAPATFVGLDYGSVEASFRFYGITLSRREWQQFQHIEWAATELLNGAKLNSHGEFIH